MIWLNIPGHPGYKASWDGQIMSLKGREPRILAQWRNRKGYLEVCLINDGWRKNVRVHQLIALAFLGGPCPIDQEICHNDGNPLNNCAGNLRYDTHLGNIQDQIRHGTHASGRYEAARTHCDNGHEFTPENTMWRWGKGGKTKGVRYRKCKKCHAIYIARYRAKNPEKTRRQAAEYARKWRERQKPA